MIIRFISAFCAIVAGAVISQIIRQEYDLKSLLFTAGVGLVVITLVYVGVYKIKKRKK